ncbi:MAG: Sec-independent protein translocase protein TatB [Pseudomonadota bacterium]
MLDIGWTELIVIGVLALLVVGPKELPGLFRTVGQYVGKARSMAREFQRSMEDAARDVDGGALNQLRDAKRDFDKMAKVDFNEQAKRAQDSLTKPATAATNSGSTSSTATTPAASPAPKAETPAPSAETPAPGATPEQAAPAEAAPAAPPAPASKEG